MRAADAETLALKGLTFLARDAEALLRLLNLTGLEIDDLKARAVANVERDRGCLRRRSNQFPAQGGTRSFGRRALGPAR